MNDRQRAPGPFAAATALRRAGDLRNAALEFRDAARADPAEWRAVMAAVECAAEIVRKDPAAGAEPERSAQAPSGAVSIVACSVDASKRAAMERNYRAALGERPHEIIVITDARSLAEGYNRALARCRHPFVVFSHDDVQLLSPRPFDAMLEGLRHCAVVGLVGSSRVTGPGVQWSGHPHLHGAVVYQEEPPRPAFCATVYSLERGLVEGIQAVDGFMFAARTEVARSLGFDESTFDGFHFYDLDFSYRAHLQGRSVGVTTDVVALHQSAGDFGSQWAGYVQRFLKKFPGLSGERAPNHSYPARFDDQTAVVRFHRVLDSLFRAP